MAKQKNNVWLNHRCLNCNSKHLKGYWKNNKWILEDEFFCRDCCESLSINDKNKKICCYFEQIAKPWEDPESLFCDGDFLTASVDDGGLGIDIRKGNECGDNH